MKKIIPLNYELSFEPDLTTFKFEGKEKLLLDIKEPTKKIVLNAAELEIKACSLFINNRNLTPEIKLDSEEEELSLSFTETLSGKAILSVDFTGTLNDQLVGLYRSKYHVGEKEKFMATSQFEAADARRAFPCFDEPEAKSTFDITLITKNNETAISNMPVKEEKVIDNNRKSFVFEKTPFMSTYLLYLSIGEFEYIEERTGKALIRVITTPGKKEQGRFALELGKKFLEFYEHYFQIPYPLPKMDLIAIPDFAAGAMENWGAITFRENALLFDTKFSSTATKQRIAEIIAHEIAHQWFGNLVTMKWWNDLWLNESFATYMATKAVDSVFPEFDFWSQFMSDSTESAMRLDSLKSSHPIEAKVKTPKEIAEIFDDISYDKGGSILRMLNNYLGENDFIEGIKSYLNKYKYSNTESVDLWDSFEKASEKPVKEMLKNWIKNTGYPLVEIKEKRNELEVTQSRFLLEKQNTNDTWSIPFSISFENKKISLLLENSSSKIKKETNFYKANEGQYGFYRVKYPASALAELKSKIKSRQLSNIDRWGIQNDFYALCKSGEAATKEYLELAEAYIGDEDFLVCSDIQDNLASYYYNSYYEKFNSQIIEYNKKFLKAIFDKLTWEVKKGERHTTPMLRGKTLAFLGKMGDEKIIEESKRRFDIYVKEKKLTPDLQSPVFSLMAWNGDERLYNLFKELYKKAKTQEEKIRFLGAISSFKNKDLLQKTFDFMLSDEIRYSDMIYPIAYLAGNPVAKPMLWPWTKANWKILEERLGETKMLLRRIINNLAVLSDEKSEKDITEFFKKNPTKGIEMSLAQSLEKIKINTKYLERMRKEFS